MVNGRAGLGPRLDGLLSKISTGEIVMMGGTVDCVGRPGGWKRVTLCVYDVFDVMRRRVLSLCC